MRTKGLYWLMVVVLLMGAISVNFSTTAYAAVYPETIHEVPAAGGFKSPIIGGEFDHPEHVAVDLSGNVYVTDGWNGQVQKFDSNGNYLLQWGKDGSGNGEFKGPDGIAVDASGNVYVGDYGRIQKFDSSGNYLLQWGENGSGNGQFDFPQAIAVDASGNVYVVDSFNDRIQKFDSSGNYLLQWGENGSGDGQFDFPQGIAIDISGNVYVSDGNNNRIQKFDSSGTYVTKWGGNGSENGQFDSPQGIAVDNSGNVYVTDAWNYRIQKFDSSGTYVTQWGSEGVGNGQYHLPIATAVDNSGNVYVVDSLNNRIQKFDSNGTYVTKWGRFGKSTPERSSTATDSNGNVYVMDHINGRIQKFDSSGNYLLHWGKNGSGNGEFGSPQGIAVDASGNVYVSDTFNNRIQKFDSSGTYVTQWGKSGSGHGKLNFPGGIAVDTSGNVYVADTFNHRIQKFDSNGLYVTQWGSKGSGDGEFDSPTGIAVDTNGNVYVTDSNNNRIQKIDSKGLITQWGRVGIEDGELSFPQGIAVDTSGNVYVTETFNNRIQMFNSSGTYVTRLWGSNFNGFNFPVGVTFNNSGNLYVLDMNGGIRKFSLNNNARITKLTFTGGTLSPSFTPDTTSYTASVATSVYAVTITPVLEDPMATVDVSGASGTVTRVVYNNVASFSVPLNVGENPIAVTAKAMDGVTKKIYTINVTRTAANSSNADLNSLALSSGSLNPMFVSGTTSYTASVGNSVSGISVTPTVADSSTTVKVNGVAVTSGSTSEAISLNVGGNTITVETTAQDGTTKKTYTVTVTRTAANSSNADLNSLVLSSGSLNPAFASGTTSYTASVGNSVSSITVTPTVSDTLFATVTANVYNSSGVLVSGPITLTSDTASSLLPLSEGSNVVKIAVTAKDGLTTRIYSLTIQRAYTPTGSGGSGSGGGSGPSNNFTIAAFAGAEFTLNNVKFSIPEGATDKTIRVTVDKVADISSLPKDAALQLLGNVYEVKKNSEGNFIKPVTIVLPFDVSKVDFNKNEVAVYWLNEQTSKWVVLDNTKVDQARGTVSGTVMHFGKFAVFTSERIQTPSPSASELNLTDIKGHWAEARIRELIKMGAINGYPDQTFKPNNHITRAEFVSILVKALHLKLTAPISKTFADTNGSWAEDSIGTVATLGIVSGFEDNTFRPSDLITREQMVAIVVRAVKLSASSKSVSFKDNSEISSWVIEDVAAATDKGLIDGYEDGTFRAKANTTRAEATAVILKSMALKK